MYLKDYGIWVEQTATDRTGMYRPSHLLRTRTRIFLLNLGGYIASTTMRNADVKKVSNNEIEGSFDTYGRHWGGPENVKVLL